LGKEKERPLPLSPPHNPLFRWIFPVILEFVGKSNFLSLP
jgi:hypothetical protein